MENEITENLPGKVSFVLNQMREGIYLLYGQPVPMSENLAKAVLATVLSDPNKFPIWDKAVEGTNFPYENIFTVMRELTVTEGGFDVVTLTEVLKVRKYESDYAAVISALQAVI